MANNPLASDHGAAFIVSTHAAIAALGGVVRHQRPCRREPAVSVRRSWHRAITSCARCSLDYFFSGITSFDAVLALS